MSISEPNPKNHSDGVKFIKKTALPSSLHQTLTKTYFDSINQNKLLSSLYSLWGQYFLNFDKCNEQRNNDTLNSSSICSQTYFLCSLACLFMDTLNKNKIYN